jgi:hypothetical protein
MLTDFRATLYFGALVDDTDKGKLKCSKKILSHSHFVYHKSLMDFMTTNRRPREQKPPVNRETYGTGLTPVVSSSLYVIYFSFYTPAVLRIHS